MSDNLNRGSLAASSNIFTALNTNLGVLDAAITASLSVAVNSTSESLTAAQFRGASMFLLTAGSPAPGAGVTLAVAAVSRGLFVVRNDCGQTVTVEISGQSVTAPTVANGAAGLFFCDGTNVYGV